MSGCEEVREILIAVARGEAVSAGGRGFLSEHVKGCPECGRKLANERMLTAGLAAVASASRTVPREAIKAALFAEFRGQEKIVPIRRPILRWAAMAVTAALVLVAIFETRTHRPDAIAVPAHSPNPPAAMARANPGPTSPQTRPVHRWRAIKAPVLQPAPQVEDGPEVSTDFFAIPYSEPLRPEERADVIRIQMPRANLAVFGLPLEGGRFDSRITADVLMGEDGVARAIRFIR